MIMSIIAKVTTFSFLKKPFPPWINEAIPISYSNNIKAGREREIWPSRKALAGKLKKKKKMGELTRHQKGESKGY